MQFTVTQGKEKQQIVVFEKLEPDNIEHFSMKNDLNSKSINKLVAGQLID